MATASNSAFEGAREARQEQGRQHDVSISEPSGRPGPKPLGGAVPKERERKIGHRRVDEKTGTVTYKKKPTSELMAAIQLGIGQSIGGLSSKPERDLLMQDFGVVQSVFFPSEGSNLTPAHHYSDFRFKTYAPMAFRFFRELFSIRPDDFMISLCDEPLTELSNPGAGGSIFYISEDDEFIIKTAQHKEASFLQKLLPGYYMNLNQNPRTLLPKFYGLYCYQCGGKNIRFVVMNNILPSTVKMHEKYDLKGSTHKRKASKSERAKSSPTLKDLDFMDAHPEGLLMEKETCDALIKTIQRDCRVLESFKIMDYSLLVGIHNLDIVAREKGLDRPGAGNQAGTSGLSDSQGTAHSEVADASTALQRGKSIRTKVTQYSTPMESIQAEVKDSSIDFSDQDIPPGGIPAKNTKGERLLLYLGIIDILQCYRLKKKFEHTFKAMINDGDTISVTRPSFYGERFQAFFKNTVFRKAVSPLKHSPSKRKPGVVVKERFGRAISTSEDKHYMPGTVGGRPDLLIDSSTPPPSFAEALASGPESRGRPGATITQAQVSPNLENLGDRRSERGYFQTIQQQEDSIRTGRVQVAHSPLSVSESTPTYTEFTEGTPSYTASSPSCSSDVLAADTTTGSLPLEQNGPEESPAYLRQEESPSKLMATSTSTEASYVSALSSQDHVARDISMVSEELNKMSRGATIELSVQPSLDLESGADQPRVSVVSQKSSDTSVSIQSGYSSSIVSAYTDSVQSEASQSSSDTSYTFNRDANIITQTSELKIQDRKHSIKTTIPEESTRL